MPASYTHFYLAADVLSRSDEKTRELINDHLRTYFFGAQGADFCFFHRAWDPREDNFGRALHTKSSYTFFKILCACARRSPAVRAYAYGYITHYAADAAMHPLVYQLADRSPFKHTRTEGAIDEIFRSRPLPEGEFFVPFYNCPPDKADLDDIYTPFALAAADQLRAHLTRNSFSRDISSYRAYIAASGKIPNGKNPDLPVAHIGRLFIRAQKESVRLIRLFSDCADNGVTPPIEDFGRSFLTGKLP